MIRLENVRTNNLKGVSLDIDPHGFTVLCGVSGSGKSSLAFDTLYAEGQRRYLETLSHAARAALDRFPPAEADRVEGLPPAIALPQDEDPGDRFSTVGTATDLHDLLAILFAGTGTPHCPECGEAMRAYEPGDVAKEVAAMPEGSRVLIAFPAEHLGGSRVEVFEAMKAARLARAVVDGELVRIDDQRARSVSEETGTDSTAAEKASLTLCAQLFGVIDRVTAGRTGEDRITESLAAAMTAGAGTAVLMSERDAAWTPASYSDRPSCPNGHGEIAPPTPEDLSFRSPRGACPACKGTGLASRGRQPLERPGSEKGVASPSKSIRSSTASSEPRTQGADVPCSPCDGTRLNAVACGVTIAQSFADVLNGRIDGIDLPELSGQFRYASESVRTRVELLTQIGLGHLSLSRGLETLSAGERQRVRLASVLAADAVEALIVLDEPLGGLHQDDVPPVVDAIQKLHAQGNGVVAVDHSFALLPHADRAVELGPGAGREGGEVVYDGPAAGLRDADTPTGEAIRSTYEPIPRPSASPGSVELAGVSFRSVAERGLTVPLERLTVVTGRSGAGKTTLLEAVHELIRRDLGLASRAASAPGANDVANANDSETHRTLTGCGSPEWSDFPKGTTSGVEAIGEVQFVVAKPPTRAGRSCVATHTKAMDEIRKLLASVPEATSRGLTAKHFSFNAAGGGRCRTCQGRGEIDVPMAHLSDLRMTCPQCGGSRFEPGISDVKFRRRSVVDMLNMTVAEAVSFFRTEPLIRKRLQPVRDVGLGYVTLGQPLGTLSGGEAQRLHLASHLVPSSRGRVLFLLDEPARGLHPADVKTLLEAINLLLEMGHTVLAAEHDRQFITAAETTIQL